MRVADVMTPDVITVSPDAPLKEVIERLVGAEISSVPVVDDGRLVGIVTEADLMPKEALPGRPRALTLLGDVWSGRERRWTKQAASSRADEVMTPRVLTCTPRDDVRTAARQMLTNRVKRLVVVDDDRVVGIVSRQDLLQMFGRSDEAIDADVRRLMTSSNMPDDCHVHYVVRDGVVTVRGDVRYPWDRDIVLSMVRDLDGVMGVVGELHARERKPRHVPGPWVPSPG